MPRFEYINPLAGLALIIAGLLMLTLGYALLAISPLVVGLVLVAFYRKYLLSLLGA